MLAAAFEAVLLAGVSGAAIAAAWTWLMIVAVVYGITHLMQWLGGA